jgi:hypothetical protein
MTMIGIVQTIHTTAEPDSRQMTPGARPAIGEAHL